MWSDTFEKDRKVQEILREYKIKAEKAISDSEIEISRIIQNYDSELLKSELFFNNEKKRLEGESKWKKSLYNGSKQKQSEVDYTLKNIDTLYTSLIEKKKNDFLKVKYSIQTTKQKQVEMLKWQAQTNANNIIQQGKKKADDVKRMFNDRNNK